MSHQPRNPASPAQLRHQAELRLRQIGSTPDTARTEADTLRLVHELQVHQVELEIQNEELQSSRDCVEAGLEKYSDLYDFAPVGYLTLDREGTVLEANLTGAKLLGLDRSCLLQKRFGQFVLAPERKIFGDFLGRVFGSEVQQSCEMTLQREGLTEITARIEARLADSGTECRAVITDITERRTAERDRLILSKLECTGLLAGGLAHDFNNLLTVILLDLELAGAGAANALDGEPAEALQEAKRAALMARSLTQQLMTFADGGAPVRELIDLAAVVRESAQLAVSGSRARLEISLPADLWSVDADEAQIGQVIRNLVLNAREAMPQGGTIRIQAVNRCVDPRAKSALPPGDYLRVTIADEGSGIPAEILPKVFDPYFSTKQRGSQKGMGLGLTICHSILRDHGGGITVESSPGNGARVHLDLPARRKSPRGTEPSVVTEAPRPGRVLVMDDEAGLRIVLKKLLERMGQVVELAEDGKGAIAAYRLAQSEGRPFDVVLLDLTIPGGLGGYETLKCLVELDPAVRAIVMSGYSEEEGLREPEAAGFKGALVKPFGAALLRDALVKAMAGKAGDGPKMK